MPDIDAAHHVLRHIKKSWMADDFIEPMAFRLRQLDGGQVEPGLSVNWMEYFANATPAGAVAEVCHAFAAKGRKAGGESAFALLQVADIKRVAATYVTVNVVTDPEPNDPAHSLVTGYERFNEQVAEAIATIVKDKLPAKPAAG